MQRKPLAAVHQQEFRSAKDRDRFLGEYLKPSHQAADIPGYYADLEGEYDISVVENVVTLISRKNMNEPTKKPARKADLPVPAPDSSTLDLTVPVVPPADVIRAGKQMADALVAVIKDTKDPVTGEDRPLYVDIHGKKHLYFEAWQIIGAFFGATPQTEWTKELLTADGKPYGAKARVVVFRKGQPISAAEAVVSLSEANWKGRAMHALESMAQTRAAAKALKMAYSWVVVLAGFDPTPAEEAQELTEKEGQPKLPRPNRFAVKEATVAPEGTEAA